MRWKPHRIGSGRLSAALTWCGTRVRMAQPSPARRARLSPVSLARLLIDWREGAAVSATANYNLRHT